MKVAVLPLQFQLAVLCWISSFKLEAALKALEAELVGSAYNVTSPPAQHFCRCVFHLLVLQLEANSSTLTPSPYPVNGSNFVKQEALVSQTVSFNPGLACDRIHLSEL